MILTILWISFWSFIAIFTFLFILTKYNWSKHNSAFSNPFKNARSKKQTEEEMREYLIKWNIIPELLCGCKECFALWSVKSVSAKPTNPYHKTNWDFYIEFKFIYDGKDHPQGWGTHINNISRFDLTIEPGKHIFSIRRQFVDTFTQLTSVANRYAEYRNTTVENLKIQFERDQKLKQIGIK